MAILQTFSDVLDQHKIRGIIFVTTYIQIYLIILLMQNELIAVFISRTE